MARIGDPDCMPSFKMWPARPGSTRAHLAGADAAPCDPRSFAIRVICRQLGREAPATATVTVTGSAWPTGSRFQRAGFVAGPRQGPCCGLRRVTEQRLRPVPDDRTLGPGGLRAGHAGDRVSKSSALCVRSWAFSHLVIGMRCTGRLAHGP